jgi:2',3'-cyclic-nucleotide 2'-phosphodiesterase (5'-nucleotidase family)
MLGKLKISLLFLAACGMVSCHTHQVLVKTSRTEYHIDSHLAEDSAVIKEYQPYKKQMDAQMNGVIGQCEQELTKSYDLPETLLGNFFSDAVLTECKKIDPAIDFALATTKGGLRNNIAKGDIHLSNVFELMPFENETVLLTLKGADVQLMLQSIANAGGEPVAGIKMDIKNQKAVNVLINGQPFDPAKTYRVLTSDYIAGGGDHIGGLQNPAEKKVLGLKIRDALIAYIKEQAAAGKKINAQLDGRITKS